MMDAATEARLRAAAADAMYPHHAVIIRPEGMPDPRYRPAGGAQPRWKKREHPPGWSPRPESQPRPKRDLPEGVYYRSSNGNGKGERKRPYSVQVRDDGEIVCLGYFTCAEVAAAYRAWALQERGGGRHWRLTPAERLAWEQQNYSRPVSYRHVQIKPAVLWTIIHRLEFQPDVTVFDSAHQEVWPDVEHLTADTIRLRFLAAMGGEALCS